ncbi:MAG: PAS domain S-box protein [Spirochaetaceae bacterium]|nr:PAS domain S-box protein [Spirochaetaceae bacterium]
MDPSAGASELLFRSVVEESPNGIFLMDSGGSILEWNRSMERITLIRRDAALGRSMFEVMDHLIRDEVRGEEMRDRIRRGYRVFLDTGSASRHSLSVENVIQRPDGSRRFIEINLFRVDATIAGGIVRDISERKAAEREIQGIVEDRTRQLDLLYDLMAIAGESAEIGVILDRSLASVLAALGCGEGAVYLLDGEEGTEAPAAAASRPGPPPGREAAAEVLATGTPKPFAGPGLALPLRSRGRVAGVLAVSRSGGPDFSGEEEALLASSATQLALTVEAVGLWKRAEESAILEERERLARELHDSITQLLYSLTLFARTGHDCAERGDAAGSADRLKTIGAISQQALKEMRLLVYGLRPLALEQDGFQGALRRRFEAVEGKLGIRSSLEVSERRLSSQGEESLFWVTQEALNNVLKHARASTVAVRLRVDGGEAVLEVEDDGLGFDPADAGEGLGLGNMRARVAKLGGEISYLAREGGGTLVRARLPFEGGS